MANRDWLDQNGNFADASNWSGGAVPVAGDTVRFLSGSKNINTGIDQTGIDFAGVIWGSSCRCVLGSPGSPFITGLLGYAHISSPDSMSVNILPEGCTEMIVQSSNPTPLGFYLAGGAVTSMLVKSGRGVKIGAAATITDLVMSVDNGAFDMDLAVSVDAGATVSAVYVDGGTLFMAGATAYGRVQRGRWDHMGSSKDVTSLLVMGGEFVLRGADCDVPTLEVVSGVFDASQDGSPKSVGATFLKLWPRATLNINNGARTITCGTIKVIGNPTILHEPGRTLTVSA